jgi:hypothetical protein
MIKIAGNFFLLLALATLGVSCNSPAKHVSLILQDSIVLHADHPIPDLCLAMFYFEKDGRQFIFADDRSAREIRVFNLDSSKEIEPVPLFDTGLNYIPYYFGFVVKDPDSIYLPVADYKIYCINRKGIITKKTDYSVLGKKYPVMSYSSSISRFSKGAVIKGDEIYFLQGDSRRYYFSYKPSDYHFLLKYNMKAGSAEITPISLPDNFWENGKKEMSLLMAYNSTDNEFAFGAQYSDKIFTSRDGNSIKGTFSSKSKSINEYYPYTPVDNLPANKYFSSLYSYSYNIGLAWDPYNQVYYRFVWPGMKQADVPINEDTYTSLNSFPAFTIDILDNEFRTIGSYPLPAGRYNSNHYFISKNGLYLAVNPSQKDSLTHQWVFHQFKLR